MKPLADITYRNIAVMLAKSLPVEGEEFQIRIESNLEAIKKLPRSNRIALKSAYIFSRKVPKEERNDLFQDLALALLKAKCSDEKLAYAIARCDWRDWWKKYKIRQHTSLDTVINESEGSATTIGELIVGEAEFELKMDAKLDAQTIWRKLDAFPGIKKLVQKRLLGYALLKNERECLARWSHKFGTNLLLADS